MAIDLVVEHDPYEPAAPGKEIARVIRVYNHGDEDAEDVLVQSLLSNELENPTWQRRAADAKYQVNRYDQEPDFTLSGRRKPRLNHIDHRVVELGDVNGDGESDSLFLQSVSGTDHLSHSARTIVPSILFGSADDVVDRRLGALGAGDGLNIRSEVHRDFIEPLGDINGDGLADVGFGDGILFGNPDLTNIHDLVLDESPYTLHLDALRVLPIGDVNSDNIDDFVFATMGDDNSSPSDPKSSSQDPGMSLRGKKDQSKHADIFEKEG